MDIGIIVKFVLVFPEREREQIASWGLICLHTTFFASVTLQQINFEVATMRKHFILAAVAAISLQSAHAVVIVNGVPGEDADSMSPFETLQAAVNFANAGSETEIEIHTNGPIPGMTVENVPLNHGLTIRAGAGFSPVINTGLVLAPANTTPPLITLTNLNVITTLLGTPLIVGCDVTATNCVFSTTPQAGTSAYGPAVTAAYPTSSTLSTLAMTSCTMIGHHGLQAGRGARDYVLTQCVVEGRPTDLPPGFSHGIGHNMNWTSSFGARMGTAQGFTEISEPRTLTLNRTVVRGGRPLGWPYPTLDPAFHYPNENNTIGPVTATNTVFEGLNINGSAEASRINYPTLPANQNPNSTFVHCTSRSNASFGTWVFQNGLQAVTHTFKNSLFDNPNSYGIMKESNSNVTLVGDANTYNVVAPGWGLILPDGTPLPAFEATEINYAGTGGVPNLTGSYGNLVGPHPMVTAKALAVAPAVTTDKDDQPRPMPAGATRSDIGADEINESAPTAVGDWNLY